MPHVDKHAPGTFSWIELATTDQEGAKRFYSRLFGWKANDTPMGPGAVYTTFELSGGSAGAAYTLRPDDQAEGVPPHWMLYIAVENADATAARAPELGGTVLGPPFDVADYGRMAGLRDPTGAFFSIWQANKNVGLTVAGEPGTLCWADLMTPDADRAKEFYSALFGWEISPGEKDPSGYLHIKAGEEFIGGIPPRQPNPNGPPRWLAYFYVTDCDASAKQAGELGAKVHVPPMSIEGVGRFAVMADPQGAVFAIFTEAPRQ